MSKYQTRPTMLNDFFTQAVIQPDASLIKQLHTILDHLPGPQALAIDHIVAQLLLFKNPNGQLFDEIIPPQITTKSDHE